MKNAAIICEFDPLHTGHEYLIRTMRERGAQRIVCIMSGDACQRGELAAFPKSARAQAALGAGADLVLELPFPYSMASAEFFAYGAMSVIKALGCIDTLGFGCESGDADALCKAAEILSSEEFELEFYRLCREEPSLGAAVQMTRALQSLGGDSELLMGANNTLAIEYIKAADRLGIKVGLCAVQRRGAGHGEECADGFASASYIRKKLSEGELAREYLPEPAAEIFEQARENGDVSGGISRIGDAVLAHFRLLDGSAPETAAGGGGVVRRMCAISHDCVDYGAFMQRLKTKKYTDARLRRAVIFSMCGVSEDDLREKPEYTTLLGASERGVSLLSEIKKSVGICIVSNPAMLRTLPESAKRQRLLSYRIAALRSLTKDRPTETEAELCVPPTVSTKASV